MEAKSESDGLHITVTKRIAIVVGADFPCLACVAILDQAHAVLM